MASSQSKKEDKAAAETKPEEKPTAEQKPAAALEEDDEFEDFPVDGTYPPLAPAFPGVSLNWTGIAASH